MGVLCAQLLLWCSAGGIPAALADAFPGPGGGEVVTVATVIDGDTLTIEGDRVVRLAGIQAPKPLPGHGNPADARLAAAARAALAELVLGRRVALRPGGAPVDRHRRIVAHLVREDGLWVQGELLGRGLARVVTLPDNRAAAAAMYAIEREARDSGEGLWSDPRYAVLTPDEAADHVDSFQIVEGRIVEAAERRDRIYLNFGPDWHTDFTVAIAADDRDAFEEAGIDLLSLDGETVRVRGWLIWRNGPMIEVTHPEQMELDLETDP